MMDEAIAVELRERGAMLPPWRRYPDMHPYSIGWRMGGGEWYLMIWSQWAAGRSQEEQVGYFRGYAPIPVEWADWVAGALGFDDFEDEEEGEGGEEGADPEPGVVRLAELGLVDLEAWRRAWNEPEGPTEPGSG